MEHKTKKINGIEIDNLMIPIIKQFWSLGGISYECC